MPIFPPRPRRRAVSIMTPEPGRRRRRRHRLRPRRHRRHTRPAPAPSARQEAAADTTAAPVQLAPAPPATLIRLPRPQPQTIDPVRNPDNLRVFRSQNRYPSGSTADGFRESASRRRPPTQKAMPLHLIKLAVGCESVKELTGWVAERMRTARQKGLPRHHIHITRMTPKRGRGTAGRRFALLGHPRRDRGARKDHRVSSRSATATGSAAAGWSCSPK